MTLLAELLAATTTTKYFPKHWPAAPSYGAVVIAAALAVISIVKKIIFLALVLILVAVGIGLYHNGTINKWLDTGAKYKTEITSQTQTP